MIPAKELEGALWVKHADYYDSMEAFGEKCARLKAERDALQEKLDAILKGTIETCTAAVQVHDKRVRDATIEYLALALIGVDKHSAAKFIRALKTEVKL